MTLFIVGGIVLLFVLFTLACVLEIEERNIFEYDDEE